VIESGEISQLPPRSSLPDTTTVDNARVFSPEEVDQKARILSKPEPTYTQEANKNKIAGTVVLRAVLTADGQVREISAIRGLPYGLTEKAVDAARQIRFTPAVKDGQSVSQYKEIEYTFNLY
jgi:TonB family protein